MGKYSLDTKMETLYIPDIFQGINGGFHPFENDAVLKMMIPMPKWRNW